MLLFLHEKNDLGIHSEMFSEGVVDLYNEGVVSPHLIPNIALVDPELIYSCPQGVTAASGMDALIHNLEAYISVNATMHTDPLAAEGIKLISNSIRTAVFDGGNAWARHSMAMGSLPGGIAFGKAGVGDVHAMSYPIGGMFHVPHGIANTLLLPWVMEYNMLASPRFFMEIGGFMGENMAGLPRHGDQARQRAGQGEEGAGEEGRRQEVGPPGARRMVTAG